MSKSKQKALKRRKQRLKKRQGKPQEKSEKQLKYKRLEKIVEVCCGLITESLRNRIAYPGNLRRDLVRFVEEIPEEGYAFLEVFENFYFFLWDNETLKPFNLAPLQAMQNHFFKLGADHYYQVMLASHFFTNLEENSYSPFDTLMDAVRDFWISVAEKKCPKTKTINEILDSDMLYRHGTKTPMKNFFKQKQFNPASAPAKKVESFLAQEAFSKDGMELLQGLLQGLKPFKGEKFDSLDAKEQTPVLFQYLTSKPGEDSWVIRDNDQNSGTSPRKAMSLCRNIDSSSFDFEEKLRLHLTQLKLSYWSITDFDGGVFTEKAQQTTQFLTTGVPPKHKAFAEAALDTLIDWFVEMSLANHFLKLNRQTTKRLAQSRPRNFRVALLMFNATESAADMSPGDAGWEKVDLEFLLRTIIAKKPQGRKIYKQLYSSLSIEKKTKLIQTGLFRLLDKDSDIEEDWEPFEQCFIAPDKKIHAHVKDADYVSSELLFAYVYCTCKLRSIEGSWLSSSKYEQLLRFCHNNKEKLDCFCILEVLVKELSYFPEENIRHMSLLGDIAQCLLKNHEYSHEFEIEGKFLKTLLDQIKLMKIRTEAIPWGLIDLAQFHKSTRKLFESHTPTRRMPAAYTGKEFQW